MQLNRILLTGGSGLVGCTLAPMLRERYAVTHLDIQDPGDGLPFIKGNLRCLEEVADACKGIDAVVHVAALHGGAWADQGDQMGFEVNVTGTKNILEGAARAGVKRVVFTSSIWASGHGVPPPAYLPIDEEMQREPAELYGLTKLLGEQMCRYATAKYGIGTIVLRPGGILPSENYAPTQSGFLTALVDVRDVATAHVLALEAPREMMHEVFIITADSPLCRVAPPRVKEDPAAALDSVVAGAGELVRNGDVTLAPDAEWYTIAKARRLLGYEPQFNFTLT